MGCWRFQQNLNSGFQLSLSKISEICSIRQEGWIFTFHWFVLSKKSQFLEDWIGNQESVFTQTCHSSSVSGEETAVPFFCSSNLSWDETNRWNLKFWPSRLLQEIFPIFGRLNWKPLFRFGWNLQQPLTLRTRNCCLNFVLKQFTF